jgi:mannan endo-1,4-beta-mannosidase
MKAFILNSPNLFFLHFVKSHFRLLFILPFAFLFTNCNKQTDVVTPTNNAQQAATWWDTNSPAIGWARGVNNCPSYIGKNRTNYADIAALGYNMVRIEFDPSKTYDYTEAMAWEDVVKVLTGTGMNVVLTWHNQEYFNGSKTSWNGPIDSYYAFWKNIIPKIKALPGSQSGRIIINILNEWGPANNQGAFWGKSYQDAINLMRNDGYGGRFIVDAGRYGNWLQVFFDGQHLITDKGVVFGIHIYENSGLTNASLDLVAAKGRPCVMGEFGVRFFSSASQSNKDYVYNLMKYARVNKGWGLLGWCWDGDGEGMSIKNDLNYRNFNNNCLWH